MTADPTDRAGAPPAPLRPTRAGGALVGETGGRYPGFAEPEDGDLASLLRRHWAIVVKRRWLIGAVALCVTVLGGLWALLQTPLYASTIRLQIDREPVKVVEGGAVNAAGQDGDMLRTQIELMRSSPVAERVVALARLDEDPEFAAAGAGWGGLFGAAAPAPAAERAAAVRRAAAHVVRSLSVRPVPGARLVDVTVTDPSPGRAQRIAAAFAEAFIASTLDKRFEAHAYAKTFLQDQTQQLKTRLEESEVALLDFAEREQIEVVNDKASTAETNLAQANAVLAAVITERIKNEQVWRQLDESTGLDLPQLLSNSVIDGLRGKRKLLEAEYQEKLDTFKPAYPAMVEIRNKLREIDRQIDAEVATVKGAYENAFRALKAQEAELSERVAALKQEVMALQNRSVRYNILKREVDSNRTLYNDLLQRWKAVDVASAVGATNVFIVERAGLPGAPSFPNTRLVLLIALLLGAAGGLGAAYLVEVLDDVVVSPEETERMTGLASLGVIPRLGAEVAPEAELARPRSALSEAYRSLGTALELATHHGLPRSLLVTSAGPSEGKSLTAFAVARHFAATGRRVLIIDADLRNPSLHRKIGTDNAAGLSNYLTGACTPPQAIVATPHDNLSFMPSGPLPPNAADLLSGPSFVALLSAAARVFDLVVIDGPPVLGLADVPILANAAEATAFVVAAGQTRKGALPGALRRIAQGRGHVLGVVLTKFDARKAGYGYGQGYGYGYGHAAYTYGAQEALDPAPPPPALPKGAA